MSGIYIHIPFCSKACHYCDFHFSTSLKSKDSIINSITREIHLRSNELNEDINSIYFGGGTPSLIDDLDLEKILNAIQDSF